MNKQVNVRKIAKRNPSVDLQQFHEAQGMLADLRSVGVHKRPYDLPTPYERRPIRSGSRDSRR